MKQSIFFTLIGASLATASLHADVNGNQEVAATQTVAAHAAIVEQVAKDVAAAPKKAGEIVKVAILKSKADANMVAQIVKAAVMAAPEQADVIRKCALAVAPDAKDEVLAMIAGLLKGDQVAGTASENVNKKPAKEPTASQEPEGRNPEENTVWLDNKTALQNGSSSNPLTSRTQNTGNSPNVYHNEGGVVWGGSPIVIIPPTTDVNQ